MYSKCYTDIAQAAFSAAIFLSLVLVYEDRLGDAPYFSLLFGVGVAGCFMVLSELVGAKVRRNVFSRWLVLVSALVLLVIASWVYGAFVGLLHGVRPEYVFRNFFGLLAYILFPIMLILAPRVNHLVLIVLTAGVCQILLALYSFDLDLMVNIFLDPKSISDARSSYSTGYLAIFPVCAVSVGVIYFYSGVRSLVATLSAFILFSTSVFAIVVVTASKGFFLAFVLLMTFVLLLGLSNQGKSRLVALLFFGVALILLASSIYFGYFELLLHSFSNEEIGNSIRAEQWSELFSDLSIFGNGLGAGVSSGYSRDDSGYGFELTYLNLVHKLGVWALPLFALYMLTAFLVLSKAWCEPNRFSSLVALGCLGYLIVGVGNPILLAPSCVVLHCVALYISLSRDGSWRC